MEIPSRFATEMIAREFVCAASMRPEYGDPGAKESRRALVRLIADEEVYCIPMGEGTVCDGLGKHKSHGRTVAQCYVGKRDLAEEQVRAGHACDLPRFSDGHYGAIPGACSL